jgi:hypothetical protein
VRDFLVGPSAAPSNGNIADGRIWWRCPIREVEEFEESAEGSGQSCSASTVGYRIGRINCEKASSLQRILEH